jgi:hypothetical protein
MGICKAPRVVDHNFPVCILHRYNSDRGHRSYIKLFPGGYYIFLNAVFYNVSFALAKITGLNDTFKWNLLSQSLMKARIRVNQAKGVEGIAFFQIWFSVQGQPAVTFNILIGFPDPEIDFHRHPDLM